MIDPNVLSQLVENEIKKNVEQQVQQIIKNKTWLDDLEKQIIDFAQNRILGKFKNISTIPDLVQTVETSVTKLFEQGAIPGVENYVSQTVIERSINQSVTDLISASLDNLTNDPEWIKKIEAQISQNCAQKFSRHLSTVDVNSLIHDHIDAGVERWQDRLMKKFKTQGISDEATRLQLDIVDGIVVVTEQLVANGLQVATDANVAGSLTVNNLIVKGSVNVDNKSWNELSSIVADRALAKINDTWKNELVTATVELAKTSGIDFDQILVQGHPIISGTVLTPIIKESSIETLGKLRNLEVAGSASFNENTVNVFKNRVGINTERPEMALSVWDEEVAVGLGKLSKDRAYIGTSRKQSLVLGVNRSPSLEINADGLVIIQNLRIDRWRISHSVDIPGTSGTRGDFVLNSDPKPDSPFAWVCLGGFRWQPLRSA